MTNAPVSTRAPELPRLTIPELETLIAVLTHAEDVFALPGTRAEMAEALKSLRDWRSMLLVTYMNARLQGGRELDR